MCVCGGACVCALFLLHVLPIVCACVHIWVLTACLAWLYICEENVHLCLRQGSGRLVCSQGGYVVVAHFYRESYDSIVFEKSWWFLVSCLRSNITERIKVFVVISWQWSSHCLLFISYSVKHTAPEALHTFTDQGILFSGNLMTNSLKNWARMTTLTWSLLGNTLWNYRMPLNVCWSPSLCTGIL